MAEDGDNDEAVPSSGKRKLEDTYNNFSTAIKSQRATSSHGDRAHSLDDFYQGERRSTTSDDPSLHQGRVRKNQHVQGNFPSFVQISWKPPSRFATGLANIGVRAATALNKQEGLVNLVRSPFEVWLPLHISLSSNLQLKGNQREPFIQALEEAIKETRVKSFTIKFTGLKWYADNHATPPRHYLCLEVAAAHGPMLNSLLWAANKATLAFQQQMLYYDDLKPFDGLLTPDNLPKLCCADKFHVSLAWTVEDPTFATLNPNLFNHEVTIEDLELPVSSVRATIGDIVRDIALGSRAPSTTGKGTTRLF